MKLYRKRDLNRCGIYGIRNIINNKIYVGKSVNIYERMRFHINKLNKKDKNDNIHLINSWHKYGRENFEYIVLEELPKNDKILKEKELYWILKLKSNNRNFGYNLRLDSDTKCILSEETRKRMSISKIKMYSNPEYDNKKHSHKYWKNNPEAVKKMAKKVSEKQHKFKIQQFDKNNNFIKEWFSVQEIIKNNPNYKWQNIYSVCNGYKPSIYGYIWRKIKI
jgi:group I intron endonuclease